MTSTHRKLRRRIGEAIPRDWHWRTEGCGHWVDPAAKWRADVLAKKDECVVAFEAQLQYEAITRRSEAMLWSGVWPIWVFPRVPKPQRVLPLLAEKDLRLIPSLLAALYTLPSPKGLTWKEAQPALHEALRLVLANESPEAPL